MTTTTRRTALQAVAVLLAALIGRPTTRLLATPEEERDKQAPQPTERRPPNSVIFPQAVGVALYLDQYSTIALHYKGKTVELDKNELMAALSEPRVG